MIEIAIIFLLTASLFCDVTVCLILDRILRRLSASGSEKTPAVLEKKVEKTRVKRINRLTERSRKWLDARKKNGKE